MTASTVDQSSSELAAASGEDRVFARVTGADVGVLVMRLVLGVVFIAHGAQKLFGWFGGNGLDGTARFFESSGFSPGKPLAFLAGLAEFGGGIALILGLLTSFAGAALVATMAGATAVSAAGGNNAFFAMDNGYEFTLTLTGMALAITLIGAGRLALDNGRFWDRGRVRFTLAALGIVGALIVVLVR